MLPRARLAVKRLLSPRRRLSSTYDQGAQPPSGPYTRQYFYTIDDHGQLFMHDARVKNFITAFKDLEFLDFFHTRIRANTTGHFTTAFPYISPCGRELNYIQPTDAVFVFRELTKDTGLLKWGGTLTFPFDPAQLSVNEHGRIYHPSPCPDVAAKALLASHLGIELGKHFVKTDRGTILKWQGVDYTVATAWGQ